MQNYFPPSFIQLLAGILSFCAIIAFGLSFKKSIQSHSIRLFAILLIGAIALFSNNGWVYFASVFIIATAMTETTFLQNLAAIIRGDKHYFDYLKNTSGHIPPSQMEENPTRRPIEFKILNTLWTKQVNKFPDFSGVWTFRINASSPEFMEFREAGNKLLGEGLIGETDQGQFHLTHKGLEYCKQHFREFPPDQWWPKEQINEEQLRKLIVP